MAAVQFYSDGVFTLSDPTGVAQNVLSFGQNPFIRRWQSFRCTAIVMFCMINVTKSNIYVVKMATKSFN
jgi:hypothetical protein